MLLRPAICTDLPALHAIERDATELYYEAGFAHAHVAPRAEADMRHLLKYTTVLVACDGDEPVAYASYYARGPFLHLEEIAVRRDRQRRGLGRTLATQVLQAAAHDPQCTHLSLVTYTRAAWALGLYTSLGFHFLGDDEPAAAAVPQVALLHEIAALEATVPGQPRAVMVRAKPVG